MRIIILAAGMGTRAMPLTRNTPKSLLDIGDGVTLLERQLDNIKKSGVIDEVVLVIGHLADQIEAKIKMHKGNGLKITTLYNPFYDVSNNLITLWLSNPKMDEDFLITNGDNIFEPDVFSDLVKNGEGIHLTINKKKEYVDDDMKVNTAVGIINRVSKQIENEKADCESVGLVLIKGEKYRKIFKDNLEKLARNREYINKFWLEVFNLMASEGIAIKPFEIDGKAKWKEVDFHLDLDEARRLLKLD
jgi:L-glutamine-phosphate cytidylyltransferase